MKMRQFLAALMVSFLLGIQDGYITLWKNGSAEPNAGVLVPWGNGTGNPSPLRVEKGVQGSP